MAAFRLVLPLLCCLVAAGCGGGSRPDLRVEAPASVAVTSPAFRDGEDVPARFTCDGAGTSPPLTWSATAGAARSWALVVDDPDAPGGTYVHWVVLDVPAATRSVGPGAVPGGGVQADNSAGDAGYAPPCPPSGRHRYRFSVYGLSAPTGLPEGAALSDALAAIESAAVVRGTLQAGYRRR